MPSDGAVLSELPPFDMLGLLKQQMAGEEPWELSAAEIARLPRAGDEPPDTDEVPWWLSEEFTGSDAELEAAFVRSLPPDIRAEYEAAPWTGSGEALAAGFFHHDELAGPRGDGFVAGGEHDTLAPGAELAIAAAAATAGLANLGESELIGVLCAWQRLTAWTQARQAACVDQLMRRRKEQSVALKCPAWHLIVEALYHPPYWVHAVLWVPLIAVVTLGPLRPMKGLMIALQYHHKAEEGRFGGEP